MGNVSVSRCRWLQPEQRNGGGTDEERNPRFRGPEPPTNPPTQPSELIPEGRLPFRFQDVDLVVVVAPICGKRPKCRLALAAHELEFRANVLAAELPLAALIVARHLVHEKFRDEASCPTFGTSRHLQRWRAVLSALGPRPS